MIFWKNRNTGKRRIAESQESFNRSETSLQIDLLNRRIPVLLSTLGEGIDVDDDD